MHDDSPDQPLTEHLVDQFAAYFVMTMLAFYGYQFVKREYQKKSRDTGQIPDAAPTSRNGR